MGADRVEDACKQLFASQVTTLVSWGTAAGLKDTLQSGDLILPDFINTQSGQRYNADSAWNNNIYNLLTNNSMNVHRKNLYLSDKILSTPDQKKQIFLETGCIAADMESGIIAKFASENNISFISIRTIIDELNNSIPGCIMSNLDNYGHVNIYKSLPDLIRKPKQFIEIYRLYQAMQKSRSTLNTIANKIQVLL